MKPFDKISVIGLGYIGLPTAAMLASTGLKVVGIDINKEAVDTINQGKIHIVEPGLDEMVHSVINSGHLQAFTLVQEADVFMIAVPTPFKGGDHEPDLSFVEKATRNVAKVLRSGNLVILESTSPVGTTDQMSEWLAQERPDLTFPHTHGENSEIRIAYCPERVLPGKIMAELINNDRIIGGMTPRCSQDAISLYKSFVKGECVVTNAKTAEMTKLTENSFRDVNIAFANELSIICHDLGIDVKELISLANRHPRVNILQPGPGVGGHCIAVDPWFIVSKSPDKAELIRTARNVNDSKPKWVLEQIELAVNAFIEANPSQREEDITIGCYGLAFKADIDDLRESPALGIVRELAQKHRGKVIAIEPNITELNGNEAFQLVNLNTPEASAHINVLLVKHREFADLEKIPTMHINVV